MIRIVPAIDLIDGCCVRLTRGDYRKKKVYDGTPADVARSFADCGVERIHVVDLDGAKAGSPRNLRTLEQIAGAVSCELEWGGGIADDDALEAVFGAGATHAIIGSIAALHPCIFSRWLMQYGPRMILGADVRDGLIAVKGWQESAPLDIDSLLQRFLPFGLKECIVTDISRDGMLQGPSFYLYKGLQERFPDLTTIVSGGVSSLRDVRRADEMGLPGIIVGKAIYENRITLKDLATCLQNG